MKKIFWLLLAVSLSASSFAQTQEEDVPASKSKAVEFMAGDGAFFIKEFYDLPKVKGVDCKVLIITNVVSGEKMGCLRLETQYRSQYGSDNYIGTLDSDELDACIQSLEYIKNRLLISSPEVYTEAEYTTRDGVELGAYFIKSKWTAYVYTKSYTSRSAEFLDAVTIDSFISVMQQAKSLIENKTK